jgi:Methyltransferase domain
MPALGAPSTGSDACRQVAEVAWRADDVLEVGGVQFVARPLTRRFPSSSEQFCLAKRPDLASAYLDLIDDLRPTTIVELGVFQGGSCALMALAADPDVLVAFELQPKRVPALDTLIAERGLGERVHVHYGVDQADAATLRDVVRRHLGSRRLDLVVDDASHLVGPSRISFNTLFPFLRPGGVYIIEDWSWAHVTWLEPLPGETPLTRLVFEITMAQPSRPGLISELRVNRDWAVVVRGDAEVDASDFDVSACYSDRGRALLAAST